MLACVRMPSVPSVRRALVLIICAVGLPLFAGACGPIQYVRSVTGTASRLVDEAREVDAEKWAPYDWYTATAYLHMAREKVAYGDFQNAIKYGDNASESARRAKRLAVMKQAEAKAATPASAPATPSAETSQRAY